MIFQGHTASVFRTEVLIPERACLCLPTRLHGITIEITIENFCSMFFCWWLLRDIVIFFVPLLEGSAAAGVARPVQCLTTDWTIGVRSPTEADDFSSTLCVQTGSGAHPASYTVGTGGSLPGGKARPGRDADRSPPSSAEVKKE
jgi:hypothetical protein